MAEYLLRDQFHTDRAVGAVNGTGAEPGPGTRTVTDTEGTTYIYDGRLLGIHQDIAGPTWGNSQIAWSSCARQAGRTFVGLIWQADTTNESMAMGWATSDAVGDPTADGHGWYVNTFRAFYMITPGQTVTLQRYASDYGYIRSMQYLCLVVLNDIGAVTLLSTFGDDTGGYDGHQDTMGVPQYPMARIAWAEPNGTDDPLYPYMSGYGSGDSRYMGFQLDDVRVCDVAAWASADALAEMADRFTRGDSAVQIGNGWAAESGTWGIDSNSAYCVAPGVAWKDSGVSNGIYQWTVTTPASNQTFYLVFRRDSAGNYLRWAMSMATNQIALQVISGDAVDSTVWIAGIATAQSTTYDYACYTDGNSYHLWIDGVLMSTDWRTDAGSNYLADTGFGIGSAASGANSPRFDRVAVYEHTVDLAGLIPGQIPTMWTPGTVLESDTFTGTNGTRLADHVSANGSTWDEVYGIWSIQGNHVEVADDGISQDWHAVQEVGRDDYECSVDITCPVLLQHLMGGLVVRYTDDENRIVARFAVTDPGAGLYWEIEVVQRINNVDLFLGRATMGSGFPENTPANMKIRVLGDEMQIFVDDRPRFSHILPPELCTGSKCGIYRAGGPAHTTQSLFDNWVVKTCIQETAGGRKLERKLGDCSLAALLTSSGFTNPAKIRVATDEQLTVAGVTDSQLALLREVY